jgi:hypothetical protein
LFSYNDFDRYLKRRKASSSKGRIIKESDFEDEDENEIEVSIQTHYL